MKNKRCFSSFISWFSVAITIVTCFKYTDSGFGFPIYLIPICFTVLWFFNSELKKDFLRYPGITVILSVMFTRYLILPLVLVCNASLSVFANNYEYLTESVIMMLVEMIGLFIALNLSRHEFRKKISYFKFQNSDSNYKIVKNDVFAIIAIGVLILLFITDRSLTVGFSLMTQGYVNEYGILDESSSYNKLLWQALTTWLYVYTVYRCKSRYDQTSKTSCLNLAIAFTLLFLIVTYISQDRISRWYTLVNAIASLFLLCKLFPSGKRKIFSWVLIPAFVLLLTASIFKNAVNVASYNDGGLLSSTNIDSYFAGPVAVNNSIGFDDAKDVGLKNIIFDVFNNMPVVNHYLPKGRSTVYLYNDYLGRIFEGNGDQIIPMVGQSYVYFGWPFCFLLSFLCVFAVRKCDYWFETKLTPIRYLAAFAAVWMALGPILNMTLILSWVYIRIIPAYLVFIVYERIGVRRC